MSILTSFSSEALLPVSISDFRLISPYLHIKKGEKYPATLITAGMNDPFVVAWQPAKFAALLQTDNASGKPILFWTDFQSGHGMIGMTRKKALESWADFYSFALWQMGNTGFQVQ